MSTKCGGLRQICLRLCKKTALKLYESASFGGNEKSFYESCDDLTTDFPNGCSSIIIKEHTGRWQVFTEVNFGGATVNLDPGRIYDNLEQMGLRDPVKSFRMDPSGKITALKLFERHRYGGSKKKFCESCDDLTTQLPNGASSIIVKDRTKTWQVFTEVQFGGVTVNLDPGIKYKNLEQMGLQNSVKSFRKAPELDNFPLI